jgi:ribosomal protein S25
VAKTIGTRFESSLHRDLKFRYTGQGGQTEAEVGGFVADGISAKGEFIEVQTGSFAPLKKKVQSLALLSKVRIIHPVIINKYIEVFDDDGKRKYRRKSPIRGSPWNIFDALIYAPELPLIPGLIIEIAMIDAVEIRVNDGKGSWRRKGVSIKDRTMTAFHERIILKKPTDYLRFVPIKRHEELSSRLLSEKVGIHITLARKTLYVLVKLGILEKTGKKSKLVLYQLALRKKNKTGEKNSAKRPLQAKKHK